MTEATMPRHPTTIRLEVERAFADHRLIEYSIWEIEALERKLTEEQQEHKATLSLAREAREEIERLNGVISDVTTWVPVTERLPKPSTRVLTYTVPSAEMLARREEVEPSAGHTKAEAIAGIAGFDWHISEWIEYEGDGFWSPDGNRPPTHWMPLPEAPK